MPVTVTPAQLRRIVGGTPPHAQATADAFNAYAHVWGIDRTALRTSHFLAQICHESKLRFVREIWGPSSAQKGYEGRTDLGNTTRGDGKRFMGRGLLQVTGRANYRAFTAWIRRTVSDAPDFESNPDALASFPWAFLSACWFWDTRKLNTLADRDDLPAVTKKVNGGTNGLADRQLMLARAKDELQADDEHFATLLGRPAGLLSVPASETEDGTDATPAQHWPEDDLKPYEIEALQIRLRELGYFTVGAPNRDFGGATRGALIAFQTDHDLQADGHYTAETREALADDANTRPIAIERQTVTAKDLAERGSRTVAATQEIKKTSLLTYLGSGLTAVVGTVAKYYSDASSYLATARDTFADLPWIWLGPLLLAAIVAYLHWQGSKAEAARVDDERKFKNTADPSPKLVNRVLGQNEGSA